jgi:DNA-binding transcriptional ArsR family regulator
MSETMSRRQPTQTASVGNETSHDETVEVGEILAILDAEYTRSLLEAIRGEAMPARDLAEVCGASRPTIYRRLNKLQEAGLVESSMEYDGNGHHRTVFENTFEKLTVDMTDNGVSVTVDTSDRSRRAAD